MSKYNALGARATAIESDEEGTHVRYHSTNVVSFTCKAVTLRSGGWRTATTKRRMNQASQQFGLGFTVYQKDFGWFVDLWNGETADFKEGMTFAREMAIQLTRKIAWAASLDAANRSMWKAGRTKWSREDFNVAVAEFDMLWPLEMDIK